MFNIFHARGRGPFILFSAKSGEIGGCSFERRGVGRCGASVGWGVCVSGGGGGGGAAARLPAELYNGRCQCGAAGPHTHPFPRERSAEVGRLPPLRVWMGWRTHLSAALSHPLAPTVPLHATLSANRLGNGLFLVASDNLHMPYKTHACDLSCNLLCHDHTCQNQCCRRIGMGMSYQIFG